MSWLNLLKANTRKEFISLKRYFPNTMATLISFYIIFLCLFTGILIIGSPSTQDTNTQFVIVSYIFWYLALIVVQHIGYQVGNEAIQGTLEQLSMSPMGIWRIMLTRLIASVIMESIIIVLLLYLAMLTTGQWLNVDVLTLLPILFLTITSMIGLGLIIAGMTIVLKQVQAFLQILQFILAGLVFVPLSISPYLSFLPIAKGVDLVRGVMINNLTFKTIEKFDYIILSINALFYFIIGLVIFLYCERVALKKGLLAHY
jgi:ABC-2 type transport system permease protein